MYEPKITIHVSIGNSDDKLTQAQWSQFFWEVNWAIDGYSKEIYGRWVSPSTEPYQNACWSFRKDWHHNDYLKKELRRIADTFDQDAITWLEGTTQFLERE